MIRLALLSFLAVAGCYNPKINEGAFTCSGTLCPSGFSCVQGRCYRMAPIFDMTMQAFRGICDGNEIKKSFDAISSGALVFNTETGDIVLEGAADAGTSDGGASAPVLDPTDKMGFRHLVQSGAPGVGLWTFSSLNIRPGVRLTPASQSKSVLALAACDELRIEGNVQWQGYGAFGGLPGKSGCRRLADSAQCDNPPSGGGPGGDDGSGGGGGGYGKRGSFGVDGDGVGMNGGSGSDPYPTTNPDSPIPVFVGAGGGGGGVMMGGGMAGTGGNGGGGVIIFGRNITIAGKIDVSGSAGGNAERAAALPAGGGGGGSGGTILISGDRVKLDIGHSLVATGGMGGSAAAVGGGAGGAGGDGRIRVGSRIALEVPGGAVVSNPSRDDVPPVSSFP